MDHLNDAVIEYFTNRREYFADLPSYKEAYGKDVRLRYWLDDSRLKSDQDEIFDNTPHSHDITTTNIARQLSVLYRAGKSDIVVGKRFLMCSGGSWPVKVHSVIYEEIPKTSYIKQFDMHRLFGVEAYNILSGKKPLDFIFSDEVIVEDEASGKLASKMDRQKLLRNKTYLTNLVRLEALAQVLSLDDLGNTFNTSIDHEYTIHLFDFDKAFSVRRNGNVIGGLENVSNLPIDEILHDEQNLIASRASREWFRLQTLINIMKKIDFQKADANFLGFNNMGEYLESKLNEISR